VVVAHPGLELEVAAQEPLDHERAGADGVVGWHQRQPAVGVIGEHADRADRAAQVQVIGQVHEPMGVGHRQVVGEQPEVELRRGDRRAHDVELASSVMLEPVVRGQEAVGHRPLGAGGDGVVDHRLRRSLDREVGLVGLDAERAIAGQERPQILARLEAQA
jgi:hypothetical protein